MHKLDYLQHREEKVASHLALIAGLLSDSRDKGTIGDMGASYNTQTSMKMKMTGQIANATMSNTSMMRRTARSKSKMLPLPLLLLLLRLPPLLTSSQYVLQPACQTVCLSANLDSVCLTI